MSEPTQSQSAPESVPLAADFVIPVLQEEINRLRGAFLQSQDTVLFLTASLRQAEQRIADLSGPELADLSTANGSTASTS